MKIEQAREIAEKALAQLADSLARGQSEELKDYLRAMAKFPCYSLNNVLLILSQQPNASRIAGYHAWQQLGRQVNRGAKGILIFAPAIRKKETCPTEKAEASSFVQLVGFRGIHVFAEEDTSGQPLPSLSRCRGGPSAYSELLRQFAFSLDIELVYSDHIRPALGQCSRGKIESLPGLEPAIEFSVLAHELGRHLLHFGELRQATTK